MLLTSLIRKHMYPYISENNFGTSKQIIVSTGYKFYKMLFINQIFYILTLFVSLASKYPNLLTHDFNLFYLFYFVRQHN
jgi:hypothetical protein